MSEDRPIDSPDRLEQYLQQRQDSEDIEDIEIPTVRVAVVRLGGELYALPADGLKQVCKVESVVPVPGCPSAIAGLIQVGGEIVGIVDLSELLNARHGRPIRRGHAMIYEFGRERVGLLVSSVEEVVEVPTDEFLEQNLEQETAYIASEIWYADKNVPYINLRRALASLMDMDEEMLA